MSFQFCKKVLCMAGVCFSATAFATPITVQSYDMNNGDSGLYKYWDDSYTGSGDKTTNRAYLSGGTGDLTDGIIAADNWNNTEGTSGPYVGWYTALGIPAIDFHFGQPVNINSVTFYVDDSDGFGGVFTPAGVNIGSTFYSFDDPLGSAPTSFTVSDLNLTLSDLNIEILGKNGNRWVFVSEIAFDDGKVLVPVPSTLALLGLGLIGAGAAGKRKTRQTL